MHPYGTEALLDTFIGTNLEDALSTRDLVTTGTYAEAREKADNYIDASLGQIYPVPFDAYPATPGTIKDISDFLTVYHLLLPDHRALALEWKADADDYLAKLLSGAWELPGVGTVDASEGRIGIVSNGPDPTYAGYDEDGYDRTGGF